MKNCLKKTALLLFISALLLTSSLACADRPPTVAFTETATGHSVSEAQQRALQQAIDRHSQKWVVNINTLKDAKFTQQLEMLQSALITKFSLIKVEKHHELYHVTVQGLLQDSNRQPAHLPHAQDTDRLTIDSDIVSTIQSTRAAEVRVLDALFANPSEYFHRAYHVQLTALDITGVGADFVEGVAQISIERNSSFWQRYAQLLKNTSQLAGENQLTEGATYRLGSPFCNYSRRYQELVIQYPQRVAKTLQPHLAYPLQLSIDALDPKTGIKQPHPYIVFKNVLFRGQPIINTRFLTALNASNQERPHAQHDSYCGQHMSTYRTVFAHGNALSQSRFPYQFLRKTPTVESDKQWLVNYDSLIRISGPRVTGYVGDRWVIRIALHARDAKSLERKAHELLKKKLRVSRYSQ